MSQTPRQFKRGQDTKIPQSSGPPEKVGDEDVHKELGERMERAATIASSLEAEQDSGSGPRCQDTILGGVDAQTRTLIITSSIMANLEFCDTHNMVAYFLKPEGSEDFHQIVDFIHTSHIKFALTKNPTIYTSLIQQFWQNASTSTLEDGEVEINVTIDGQLKTITEASLRRHLKLEDADGISSLPNTEIFEQLALMGYASDSNKLTFQKGYFSPQWRFLTHNILHCLSPKKTAWEQFSSNIATAIIFLATNRTFNFSKMIFEGMVKNLDNRSKFLMYLRFIQILLNKHQRLLLPYKRTYVAHTLTQKLFSNMRRVSKGYTRVNIPLFSSMLVQGPIQQGEGSTVPVDDEGRMQQTELIDLVIKLSDKVLALETDLQQTKKVYSTAVTKLIMKVKRLEKIVKSSKARRRAKIVVSDDEKVSEDSSKQGRMIDDIDQDAGITLVTPTKTSTQEDHPEDQLGVLSAAKVLTDVARVHTYSRRRRTVSTGSGKVSTASRISGGISTAEESVSTAGASMPVSTAGMDQGSIPSPSVSKDKGKAIMTKSEPEQATTKLKQRQEIARYKATIRLQEQLDEEESQRISRDAEVAQRLQEEIDASERHRMAPVYQAAQGFTDAEWDDILAKVAADEDLVQQLQAGEKYSEEDLPMKLVELVNQRKKFFAQQRAEAKRNKTMTPAQQKAYMSTYIKNQEGGYSIKQLKSLSFEQVELKRLFEPDVDDILWKLQRYMHDPLTWRLYDTCGIHHVSIDRGHDIFILIEKDYPLTRGLMTVMLANKLQVDQSLEMANELLRKIFIQVERPRQ
ncbi:hypothetical protein Tco_0969486 [Tanacetum coccineum]